MTFLGTKWCSDDKNATKFKDLGHLREVDKCCRAHDICPFSISKENERWGLRNTRGYTLRDCECDRQFHSCLKDIITVSLQLKIIYLVHMQNFQKN